MVTHPACGYQVAMHRAVGVRGRDRASGAGAQDHLDERPCAGDDLVDWYVLVGRVGARGIARSVLHRGNPAEAAQAVIDAHEAQTAAKIG